MFVSLTQLWSRSAEAFAFTPLVVYSTACEQSLTNARASSCLTHTLCELLSRVRVNKAYRMNEYKE